LASILSDDPKTGDLLCRVNDRVYRVRDGIVAAFLARLHAAQFHDDDLYIDEPAELSGSPALKMMQEGGVIVSDEHSPPECRQLYRHFCNPYMAPVPLPDVDVLAWTRASQPEVDALLPAAPAPSQRRTCRSFSSSKSIPNNVLDDVLRQAYGPVWKESTGAKIVHRPVASAGGLYPLNIVTLKVDDTVRRGRFDKGRGFVNWDRRSALSEELAAAFLPDLVSVVGPGVVCCVIAMDTQWSCRKYGARGLLYGAIEAGAVAQVLVTEAQARGVASFQAGGYVEAAIHRIAQCREEEIVLSVLLLGYEA
jgi:hypothetical protein